MFSDEVVPLAISAHGFDAYNSSDLAIVKSSKFIFWYIFKEKPRANDQDSIN